MTPRRLRNLALLGFLVGALGVPLFSLVFPGEAAWKQFFRVGLVGLAFVSVAVYAYALAKLRRSD